MNVNYVNYVGFILSFASASPLSGNLELPDTGSFMVNSTGTTAALSGSSTSSPDASLLALASQLQIARYGAAACLTVSLSLRIVSYFSYCDFPVMPVGLVSLALG